MLRLAARRRALIYDLTLSLNSLEFHFILEIHIYENYQL